MDAARTIYVYDATAASSFAPFDTGINKRHKKIAHTLAAACPFERKHSIKTFAINSTAKRGRHS